MREPIHCTACGKPLTNGTDTFGDVGCEFCWECYGALTNETDRTPLHDFRSKLSEEGEYIVYQEAGERE